MAFMAAKAIRALVKTTSFAICLLDDVCSLLFPIFFPQIAKNILVRDYGRLNRLRQPCDIDKMLPMDVFIGAIAAPGAAAK